MVKPKSVESELIKKIIFGIEDVKGADVNIMDLTKIANTVCGYFIICTGTSNTGTFQRSAGCIISGTNTTNGGGVVVTNTLEIVGTVEDMNNLIVITRGSKGAVAINKHDVVECSAKSNLKIKDLTGAGDLFAGGFLHGLINNRSTKESLEIGTEMSSRVNQIIGARLN